MRLPCKAGFWKRNTLAIGIIVLALLILSGCNTPSIFTGAQTGSGPCQADHQIGFIKTLHKELVDATGCQMNLTGVNWFGFETSTFAPHGLDVRNWRDMLHQITQLGFNTIRLPYTNQLFDPASKPLGINYRLNPDLKGLQGLALMDRIIQGAGSLGVKVILDRHDPTADLRPALWYTDQMPQSHWIADWVMLAQHYRGNATVIGGEFGGRSMGQDTEGVWQRTLVNFLKTNNISYTYWAWNPDSTDTGGILQDNWKTVNQSKLDVLNAYQWPRLK